MRSITVVAKSAEEDEEVVDGDRAVSCDVRVAVRGASEGAEHHQHVACGDGTVAVHVRGACRRAVFQDGEVVAVGPVAGWVGVFFEVKPIRVVGIDALHRPKEDARVVHDPEGGVNVIAGDVD